MPSTESIKSRISKLVKHVVLDPKEGHDLISENKGESMDQLIQDAKTLVQRLQSHDSAADSLISEASHLQNKLHAMKQYRDEVAKLNELAKHRPKSTLILGSQLENQRIQELELEVGELTVSLAEHQSALELIMNKYREQVITLLESNGVDKAVLDKVNKEAEDVKAMKEKILEMAGIMQRAMRADDVTANREFEIIQSLRAENQTLRELLQISGKQIHDTSTVIRRKPRAVKDTVPDHDDKVKGEVVSDTTSPPCSSPPEQSGLATPTGGSMSPVQSEHEMVPEEDSDSPASGSPNSEMVIDGAQGSSHPESYVIGEGPETVKEKHDDELTSTGSEKVTADIEAQEAVAACEKMDNPSILGDHGERGSTPGECTRTAEEPGINTTRLEEAVICDVKENQHDFEADMIEEKTNQVEQSVPFDEGNDFDTAEAALADLDSVLIDDDDSDSDDELT